MANWRQNIVPKGSPGRAAAAGASRGILAPLDIVPRGLSGLAYEGGRLMGAIPPETPYVPWTPFQNVAAMANIGTYQPQTPAEETASFVGEMGGSTIGPAALAYRLAGLPGLIGETAAGIGSTAGGLVTEEMGFGTTPGVLAGSLLPTAAATATQRAMVPVGRPRAARRLAASERQQVPISAGEAAGGSYLEKFTETMPGGAQARAQFRESRADAMQSALRRLTAREGAPEPDVMRAGQAITRGIDDWATRFRGEASRQYGLVESAVPRSASVTPDSLVQTVNTLRGTGAFKGITQAPLTKRISKRIDELMGDTGEPLLYGPRGEPLVMKQPETRITYEDMKELRTMIGNQLSDPSIIADTPRKELKQLYGAISDDMRRTLGHVGGQGAIDDWARANEFWQSGMQRIDDILDPIQSRKTPEDVYQAATQGVRRGSTRVDTLRDTLDPEQWDLFRRTAADELGRAPGSQREFEGTIEAAADFNPERFLTNLGNYGDAARATLFGDMPGITDLADIATGIRQQERYLWNPSGTIGRGLATALPASLVGTGFGASGLPGAALSAAGVGAGAGAMYGLQRGLQTPMGARMLTQPQPMAARGLIGMPARGATTLPSGQTVEVVPQNEQPANWRNAAIRRSNR